MAMRAPGSSWLQKGLIIHCIREKTHLGWAMLLQLDIPSSKFDNDTVFFNKRGVVD